MIISRDDQWIEMFKKQINEAMAQEAEPIIREAMEKIEIAMRERMATMLIARMKGIVDFHRDERSLHIVIHDVPGEEHHLYQTDHAAWCKHVAPRWAEMLRKAEGDEKRRLWGIASDGLRDELKRLSKENQNGN